MPYAECGRIGRSQSHRFTVLTVQCLHGSPTGHRRQEFSNFKYFDNDFAHFLWENSDNISRSIEIEYRVGNPIFRPFCWLSGGKKFEIFPTFARLSPVWTFAISPFAKFWSGERRKWGKVKVNGESPNTACWIFINDTP